MAGDLGTIIGAVRTAVTTLGFKASKEVFNFDVVPASIINKSYRIETRRLASTPILGNKAVTTDAIEIYVAYELKRDAAAAADAALDDRETIENALVNSATLGALAQRPILLIDSEASATKYLENYLVSKTVFRCEYIRDLTPTV